MSLSLSISMKSVLWACICPLPLLRNIPRYRPSQQVTYSFAVTPKFMCRHPFLMLVDFELIERARDGDAAAFGRIVTAYKRRILGTVARLVGRPEDVEDVGQEVFTRLYFSLDQLRSPEGFDAWLYRMTVNACYDHLRRHRRRPESRMADLSDQQIHSADAEAGQAASSEVAEKEAIREEVNRLLAEVSEEDRILLMMKEVEGLSLKELSAIYQVNENALKVRLFRARQRVIRAMDKRTIDKRNPR